MLRKHIRLKHYNYTEPGCYFITICSNNFEHMFSDIQDNAVKLKPTGNIITQCWSALPITFPNIKLGAHVIMPNHFHGIIPAV